MKLSIIVAVFNVEEFIADCLDSLVKVSLISDEYEIVVVNDGSTDKSSAIIECYGERYKQIKIINQKNKGTGAARNTGLTHSRGEYVWIIDGDDFINPEFIDLAINYAIEKNTDVLAFGSKSVNQLGLPEEWVSIKLQFGNQLSLSGPDFYYLNYANSYIWLYFFKRELFLKNNLLFHDSIKMQDSELMPHIMAKTSKVYYFNHNLINYRYRSTSAVNNKAIESFHHMYFSMVYVYNSLIAFQSKVDSPPLILEAIDLKKAQILKSLYFHFVSNRYNRMINKDFIKILKEGDVFPFPAHIVSHEHIKFRWILYIINLNPLLGRYLSRYINQVSPLYQLKKLLKSPKQSQEAK